MKKEQLTRDKIRQEYPNALFWRDMAISFIFLVLTGLLVWLFVLLIDAMVNYSLPTPSWTVLQLPKYVVIVVAYAAVVVSLFKKPICLFYWLRNDRFTIVKDTLVSSQDGRDQRSIGSYGRRGVHCLLFACYGKYEMGESTYNRFSAEMTMTADGMLNTALIGDTYYLVMHKKKILYVYNTKFFILDADVFSFEQ